MDNTDRRHIPGIVITTLWGCIAFLYGFTNWNEFKSPGEAGDFIAGVTAPLAFFWLILGYYQQQVELRQNTDALKLQADELKALVQQTERQNQLQIQSNQPRFGGMLSSRGSDFMVVQITNYGGIATNVYISAESMEHPSRRLASRLGRGQGVSARLATPQVWTEYHFSIQYENMYDKIGSQEFAMDDQGHIQLQGTNLEA